MDNKLELEKLGMMLTATASNDTKRLKAITKRLNEIATEGVE
tara:strand:- start:610 stop:735 length:126 start_codon:yes stop_codon:yes gene_type:complete